MEFKKEHWDYICDLGERLGKLEQKMEDIRSIFKGLKETIKRRLY